MAPGTCSPSSSSSLPAQHPHLALHLTDRALTPVISTSLPPSSPSKQSPPAAAAAAAASSSSRATFTTSPPSSPDSPSSPPTPPEHPSTAALSLAHLTTTALTSYQTAKRLTHGAPLRTMIEYPAPRGPVVLHSYLCPMSLALGTPGVRPRRSSSQGSLTTTPGGAAHEGHGDAEGATADDGDDEDEGEDEVEDEDDIDIREDLDVPMLIATVVAPAAHDLKDARRAAGRLERVAKAVQTEWVAQGRASKLPPS